MHTFLDLLLPLTAETNTDTSNSTPENGERNGLGVDVISKALCNPYLNFPDDFTESLVVYNGITGDHLFSSLMKGSRRVSRQSLRAVLLEGLKSHIDGSGDGHIVQWGRDLIGIDHTSENGPLTLTFADGTVIHEVDYVLGADGPGSKVRELLFKGREEEAKLAGSGFMMSSCYPAYHDVDLVERLVQKHPVACVTMSLDTVMGFGGGYLSFSVVSRSQPPRIGAHFTLGSTQANQISGML